MKHSDFKIGDIFYSEDSKKYIWKCTDIGTRTIIAIKLDDREDQSWFLGPPYSVVEEIFDEYDLSSCSVK